MSQSVVTHSSLSNCIENKNKNKDKEDNRIINNSVTERCNSFSSLFLPSFNEKKEVKIKIKKFYSIPVSLGMGQRQRKRSGLSEPRLVSHPYTYRQAILSSPTKPSRGSFNAVRAEAGGRRSIDESSTPEEWLPAKYI